MRGFFRRQRSTSRASGRGTAGCSSFTGCGLSRRIAEMTEAGCRPRTAGGPSERRRRCPARRYRSVVDAFALRLLGRHIGQRPPYGRHAWQIASGPRRRGPVRRHSSRDEVQHLDRPIVADQTLAGLRSGGRCPAGARPTPRPPGECDPEKPAERETLSGRSSASVFPFTSSIVMK